MRIARALTGLGGGTCNATCGCTSFGLALHLCPWTRFG
jgi:hypothetical protein